MTMLPGFESCIVMLNFRIAHAQCISIHRRVLDTFCPQQYISKGYTGTVGLHFQTALLLTTCSTVRLIYTLNCTEYK